MTTQSPYEAIAVVAGRSLARRNAALIVELHGDWRTFSRLYGSPLRQALAPATDRLAPWALRRADAVRTLSAYTTGLVREAGVEPAAEFIAFTDLEAFTDTPPAPLPETPEALFVGVLERYKNVESLAAAWRIVAAWMPEARLRIVGDGHRRDVVKTLVAQLPERVSWTPSLPTEGIVEALDAADAAPAPVSRGRDSANRPRGVLPRSWRRRRAGRRRARRRRGRCQRSAARP